MGAACCSDVSKAQGAAAAQAGAAEAGIAPIASGGPPADVQVTANGNSPDSRAVASSAMAPEAVGPPPSAPPPAPEYEMEEDQRFLSTVGELPQFEKPRNQQFDDTGSNVGSEAGSVGGVSEIYDSQDAKAQQKQAKKVVKDFVKEMVKGKKMNVMKQNGSLTSCSVSLTRALDALKIKAGGQTREIQLVDIAEICAGTEVQDIDTPLDDMCATLMLASEDCITFRMPDLNARDTFIMCLLMFCNNQQQ